MREVIISCSIGCNSLGHVWRRCYNTHVRLSTSARHFPPCSYMAIMAFILHIGFAGWTQTYVRIIIDECFPRSDYFCCFCGFTSQHHSSVVIHYIIEAYIKCSEVTTGLVPYSLVSLPSDYCIVCISNWNECNSLTVCTVPYPTDRQTEGLVEIGSSAIESNQIIIAVVEGNSISKWLWYLGSPPLSDCSFLSFFCSRIVDSLWCNNMHSTGSGTSITEAAIQINWNCKTFRPRSSRQ